VGFAYQKKEAKVCLSGFARQETGRFFNFLLEKRKLSKENQ